LSRRRILLQRTQNRFESEVQGDEERATLYLALGVLAVLKIQKSLVQKILEVSKMENSPFFDGIREEWEARGRDEGIVEAILEALEENTGQRPARLKENLSTVKDRELLKKILRRAVKSKTMEEFEKALKVLMSN